MWTLRPAVRRRRPARRNAHAPHAAVRLQRAGIFDKVQISPTQIDDVVNDILTNPVADEFLEGGTTFEIQPRTFGPVNATDDRWTESRIVLGEAVELVSHRDFEPRSPGTATLSVRTEDGEFGGQQRSDQAAITVEEIQIPIEADDAFSTDTRRACIIE